MKPDFFLIGLGAIWLSACGETPPMVPVEYITPDTHCTPSRLPGYCEYIISPDENVYNLLVADLNDDGVKDIFPHGHDPEDKAYLLPGLSTLSGLETFFDRHGCDSSDIDLDGDADIYCAHGARRGEGGFGNLISLNDGNGNFTYETPEGAADKLGRGRVAKFFNLDGDKHSDLILTNYADGKIKNLPPSAIYRGLGELGFEQMDTLDLANSGELCIETGDWNNDGFEGFILCDRQGDSRVILNQDGNLTDVTNALEPDADNYRKWTDGKVFDIDRDGRLDFIAASKALIILIYENSGQENKPFSDLTRHIDLRSKLKLNEIAIISDPPRGAIKLSVFHANDDPYPDLYIGTDYEMKSDGTKFLGDFVFYGPSFKEYQSLGPAKSGTGHVKPYNEHSIVISRGGTNWPGEVILLTPAPKASNSP